MARAFEQLAEAADDVADDQRQVARRARSMGRKRDRGIPLAKLLDDEDAPAIIDLLRRSTKRLATAVARFTQAIARGLRAEGESQRTIAGRLRVTHQRVGKLLSDRKPSS